MRLWLIRLRSNHFFRCAAPLALLMVMSAHVLATDVGSAIIAEGKPDTPPSEPTVGEKVFALQIRTLFRDKCFGCHGEEGSELKGGFNLGSRESLLEGGSDYGESVIEPGDSESSYLISMVSREESGYEMPPKESEKLSLAEVQAVRIWIDEGAPWPDDDRSQWIYEEYADGVTVQTSGGLADAWTNRKYDPADLWAFRPIVRDFPELSGRGDQSPVDAFINSAMEASGITPAPAADRRTLIRRVTLDLIGLPPTPKEIEDFLVDPRSNPDAFSALVDRLLDRPQYGEQWARHWLDVVRYADSSGFANDWERPNVWRYRDYVIRAFNQDKPFDRFTLEQLAGDELIKAAEDAAKPLTQEQQAELRIASGFLRMGPWEHTGMSVAKVTRQQFLDDITDSVGQVFLGQALQCCRCHDHKFDPIPTRDYYSFQAVFATTQFGDVATCWLPEENLDAIDRDKRLHQKRRQANKSMLQELNQQISRLQLDWLKSQGLPYKSFREAKKAGLTAGDLPSDLQTPEQFGKERIGRKWQNRFTWEMDRYAPFAFSVYNGKTPKAKTQTSRMQMPKDPMAQGVLEETKILTGGDPFADGQSVSPGVLSAVPGALDVQLPAEVSGRRTALANWINSPDNSLTSRVLVNRIWAFHFGRGIAGNPNNFGATGKKPTHPRLLDWLATELVQNNWSVKHLHRVILNSDAYRRSTQHPNRPDVDDKDPEGSSYSVFRPRRLEAEELRDVMLAVSGELNLEAGGIPIRPDMNLEAALQPRMIMGTFAPSYVPSPLRSDRNRRSIYAHRIRGHRLPFMETFNQPGSEKSCELRDQSNITPQVFTLMNSQESSDRALAFAHRLVQRGGDDAEVIGRAIEWALGRPAEDGEVTDALTHWKQMRQIHEHLTPRPVQVPTEVVREAVDENTGKPFTFVERLFANEVYQPDLGPHEVDVRTR
ncbi:MAG: PSD1 and planctomycete cytochrome C domain-containing protein, partial [Planctomycetota bacterium]